MSSLSRELVLLILQFLEEEKFKDAVHKLEQESAFFFNVKHFEEKAMAGEWDEVESYLSGFTKVDDNRYSIKIFFEIRKQKYLEALDRQDKGKALEILTKDLKAFATFHEELYKEITQLLTLNNFRENEQLSKYGDTKTARTMMLIELRKLIEANPLFRDKLVFPTLKQSRLRTLINQSLNWQHQLCKHPRSNPDIKTLFVDHSCSPSNGVRTPTPVTLPVTAVARPPTYAPIPVHAVFPPTPAASSANVLAGWMANATASSSVQSLAAPVLSVQPNQVPVLKRARTPPNPLGMVEIDYQSSEREHLMKRARQTDEVSYPAALQQASSSMDQLPKTVACTLYQGSDVTSIDFHPSCQTSVIVGCGNGEVTLWDIGLCKKLVSKPFRIWDKSRSLPFQAAFVKDPSLSTSRVRWSPDGNMIGVAFTKQLIQLYATEGRNDLCQCVEIDAHVGGVNDLAFSYPNKQLCVVTCGDDKLIKVWDLTGRKLFNFEGHEEPVYSICPHHKENIQFIFSTAIDGKIKAWLYDNLGSRVDYDAPGHGRTTMLYSADGTRLFSCGTGKDGDSFLVEWNESEGAIKKSYSGFRKKSAGVVQFDTTQNRFLAAGEDHQIKFWDMDNANILTSTDAEGGLPSVPCLRFNKEGNLLAVSTADKGFKILASTEALRSLRAFESRTFEGSRVPIEPSGTKVSGLAPAQAPAQAPAPAPAASNSAIVPRGETLQRSSPSRPSPVLNGDDLTARNVEKERASGDVPDNAKVGDLAEIVDPVKCQVVTAPDSADPLSKVVRLLYTNFGNGVLALGSEGVQKLWKWPRSEQNPSGKATATVVPQHWQPNSGLAMKNDVSGVNIEEAVPCIALSKNDSYVMSATGGTASLFNMMTFKVMTQFMQPPPTPTFLAFHPDDNNIIAVGTKDSTVHIYNVRIDEVKSKLRGHQKQITGLAFSTKLNILVSSGADARVCFWNTDTWEMRKSVTVQAPDGKEAVGGTRVQFNYDQIRLLVSNETQIAVYDASKMEFVKQWAPQGVLSAPMTCAVYSQRIKLVYASFLDGNIGVFDADTLKLKCRIAPSAYLPQAMVCSVHPLVIAAHPHDPNQFAVGMSDGSVKVLQPLECDGKWGGTAPLENRVRIVRTVLAPVANEVQIGTTTPAENGAEAERSTPGRTVLESAENGAQSGKATAEEVAESSSTSNNHAPEQTK